jgi:hypothetical protein
MYGKVFASMYEGSMVGAGAPVFSVWGYCIAKADPDDHTVELNPVLLSCIIGESESKIIEALEFLCAPDPESHCQDHAGARLVKQAGHTYFVVTHAQYRDIRNNDDRRAYNREMKRRERARKSGLSDNVNDISMTNTTPASASVSASESQEGDSQGGEKTPVEIEFEECWGIYPDKSGKALARKAYVKARKEGATQGDVLSGLNRYIAYVKHRRETGFADLKFKNGSTWFHQRCWEDEYTITDPAKRTRPQERRLDT